MVLLGIVLRRNYPYNLLRSVISDRIVLKYYNRKSYEGRVVCIVI